MYATKVFERILGSMGKVKNINLKDFMETGRIEIKLKNLTEQEKEDLSHMAVSCHGRLFDERY